MLKWGQLRAGGKVRACHERVHGEKVAVEVRTHVARLLLCHVAVLVRQVLQSSNVGPQGSWGFPRGQSYLCTWTPECVDAPVWTSTPVPGCTLKMEKRLVLLVVRTILLPLQLETASLSGVTVLHPQSSTGGQSLP